MLNTFTYNGHSSEEFGIRIEKKPVLNRPARKFKAASVPGRNGNIYQLEDAWEEIIQPYEIFAGGMANGDAVPSFTEIMEWLHSADDYVELSDTYDTAHYRKAIFVDSVDIESMWHTWGRAVINFRCKPERYLITEPITDSSGSLNVVNPTNHIAHPIINLTGAGATTLLQFGGKTLAPNMAPYILGLRELSTVIPYKDTYMWAAIRRDSLDRNPAVADVTGMNITADDTIGSLSYNIVTAYNYNTWGVGYILSVDNTTYTLSWEAYNGGTVNIFFAKKTGYNDCFYALEKQTIGSGWEADNLTFTVPSECGYVFVLFAPYNESSKSTQQFREVMLAKGTTAQPFKEYNATPSSLRVAINNTMLITFQNFGTAVIDCERENFQADGVDSNQGVSLVDHFHNATDKFLQLEKGNNTITYSGVVEMTIDPHFWEL